MRSPEPVRDLDWGPAQARELTGAMLDLWAELLERMGELPVTPMAAAGDVAAEMMLPIPAAPLPPDEIAALLRPLVFEHSALCGHPGFLAYISGSGTVPGAAADLLAAGLNPNVGGWSLSPGATELELHLMRWMAERFGLPTGAGGLMTSGGAASNFTALKAARDARAPGDVRADGIDGLGLVLYTSQEAHATIAEAADMMGMGERAVRSIPTDEAFRMRADDLERAVADDLRGRPLAVLRRRHGRHHRHGRRRPASGRSPTSASGTTCGCTSMPPTAGRRRSRLRCGRCSTASSALTRSHSTPTSGSTRPSRAHACSPATPDAPGGLLDRRGVCPRGCRACLAAASTSASSGRNGRARSSRSRCGCRSPPTAPRRTPAGSPTTSSSPATSMIALREHPDLESMCPVTLSIACFRYAPEGVDNATLDALNERLMIEIRRDGRTFPSNAVLGGRYRLRACFVNHRTEADVVDHLVDAAVSLGSGLMASLR